MRKPTLSRLLLVGVIALTVACASQSGPSKGKRPDAYPDQPFSNTAPQSAARRVSLMFKKVDLTREPADVRSWTEKLYKSKGNFFLHSGGKTYLLAAMGEKPTGGYEIKIERVEETPNGEIVVVVTGRSPAPGQIVTQALTYPRDLVAIDQTDRKINFVGP